GSASPTSLLRLRLGRFPRCHRPRNAAQRHRGSCCPRGPGLPMGRIRALAIAVQRRGCHAVHRPSSPTLVRGRLRRAETAASGSVVPFGESSLAPPHGVSISTKKSPVTRALSDGRYWARTSDPQLVELVLSQLS